MRETGPSGAGEAPMGEGPRRVPDPPAPGASRVASARHRRAPDPASADAGGRPLAEASRRVQELFRAAEAIVDEIEAEASLEADRYLGERLREADRRYEQRLGELRGVADTVIGRAEALRDEAQGAATELARLVQELRAALNEPPWDAGGADGEPTVRRADPPPVDLGPSSPPPPDAAIPRPETGAGEAPPSPAEPAVTQAPPTTAEPAAAQTEPPAVASVSEEALLCATQMAVAGEPREVIQAELGTRFGLADPAAVTDEILGPA